MTEPSSGHKADPKTCLGDAAAQVEILVVAPEDRIEWADAFEDITADEQRRSGDNRHFDDRLAYQRLRD